MFHRVPFISARSVAVAAVILVLAAISLGSSLHGTAHAGHGSSPPEVRIKAVMPEVGEEGSSVTVTLKLSRQLTEDEQFCYNGSVSGGHNDEVCIQGGIIVWDTSDDHLYEEGGSKYENGHIPSNEMVKFVFRNGETEKRETVRIADDQCITPRSRNSNSHQHGIHRRRIRLHHQHQGVHGPGQRKRHDERRDKLRSGKRWKTEEADYNKAPSFGGLPPEFDVDENTAAGQDVGYAVSATDPENDTLTYSLMGADASSFTIDSSSGQIKTKDPLDHETKDTYHVAVFVRDSKNIHGDPDSVDDNSIDVTINVNDVNEAPAFDANAPTTLDVAENTAAETAIGSPITATDPDEGDTLTYSLDDDDGAAFDIDANGQIQTKEALNYETKNSYTVIVTATDSGGNTAMHPRSPSP